MPKHHKSAVVTGGAGFIGSHLVDELIRQGFRVTIIDNLSTGRTANLNPKARFRKADIIRYDEFAPEFKGADVIFHTAALARIQPSIKDPRSTFRANVEGTFNVLMAARAAGVKRVVYSASSSAYGDQTTLPLREEMATRPKNMYALSKFMGEEMCRMFSDLYGIETVCLRYFNVYGPRQTNDGPYATVIGIFFKQLVEQRPLTLVGDGKARRDYTYVGDVVRANILAAGSRKVGQGEIVNIGCGKNYSVNEVAAGVLGVPVRELAAAIRKRLATYIPPRPGEVAATLANNRKARDILGWSPRVAFPNGLEACRDFFANPVPTRTPLVEDGRKRIRGTHRRPRS